MKHCSLLLLLQVRCRTGAPYNNGRPMRVSDLIYYRPYQIKDNFGQDWPGEALCELSQQRLPCAATVQTVHCVL